MHPRILADRDTCVADKIGGLVSVLSIREDKLIRLIEIDFKIECVVFSQSMEPWYDGRNEDSVSGSLSKHYSFQISVDMNRPEAIAIDGESLEPDRASLA